MCPDASRWREFVDSELYTPFEPFQRPPIRALLLVSMPSVLVVNVHHAAADAVAFEIMRSELAGHCAALLRHLPPPSLPFVAMEYADFARSEVASGQDEEALAWWVARLKDAPELISLPLDASRPAVQATAARHIPIRMDATLTARVGALCHAAGATPNSTLLTAWAELLHRLSGDATVVVGVPHSMRRSAELRSIVGTFVNTLPLPLERSSAAVLDAIRSTQRAVGQALPRAHVPLHRIVHSVGCRRSTAHSPLFQTMFHATAATSAEPEEVEAQIDEPTVKVDLEVEMLHVGAEIHGRMIYDPALYHDATANRWVRYLQDLTRSAIDHIDSPLRELKLERSGAEGAGAWEEHAHGDGGGCDSGGQPTPPASSRVAR